MDEGWVLPKGTVEDGEDYKDTAVREVREETGAEAPQSSSILIKLNIHSA